ncbi:MAG: tyrosine-type recombinase/integrase [Dehalococcoidia bacterium]|nr:tyrosine-type recombinase/integrase [Dehalococcoidia bacterium]
MAGKRGNAEGTIYKRTDGRWCAAVTLDGGKRRAFYGATRGAVQDKLRAAKRAIDDGLPVSSDRQKVGHFLTRWLAEVAQPTVRPSTYTRYRELLTGHVVPALGHLPLAKLGPQDLNALYGKLAQRLAPRTVGHVHRVLHRALRDALHWGLVARNVCDAVSPPKVARAEMQVLGPEQARALIAAAAGDPLEAVYTLAILTGLRQGELLALKWRDFDAGAERLTVCRSVRWVTGLGSVEGEPKTRSGRRSVLLAPLVVAALRRHRTQQTEQRLRAIAWEDNDLIFTNEIGRHIEASNLLRRSFRPLLERADLPRIRFHDLRHTAATLLLGQGVHAKIVSEMLGHSNIAITMDLYSHVTPTMQADAAAKMEALFTVAV